MNPLEELALKIRLRLRRRLLVTRFSRAVFWSCLAALVIRLIHHFNPLPYAVPLAMVLPLLVSGAVLYSILRRAPSDIEVLRLVDSELGAHDRFSTAYECIEKGPENDVERVLAGCAMKEASSVPVGKVVVIEKPRELWGLPFVLLAFLGLCLWTMYGIALDLVTPLLQRTLLARPLAKLEKTVEKLEKSNDGKKKEIADKLKKLLGDLKKERDFDKLLGKAKKLIRQLKNDVDPRMKKTLDKMMRAADDLARSRLTRKIADALRKGDMKKAADLTRNLADRLRRSTGLTKKDFESLARNFERSARRAAAGRQRDVDRRPGGG